MTPDKTIDESLAKELALYIENDADLYRQQYQPQVMNLARKRYKGIYDGALAVKLVVYLVESGLKKYRKEVGFTLPVNRATKEAAAKEILLGMQDEINMKVREIAEKTRKPAKVKKGDGIYQAMKPWMGREQARVQADIREEIATRKPLTAKEREVFGVPEPPGAKTNPGNPGGRIKTEPTTGDVSADRDYDPNHPPGPQKFDGMEFRRGHSGWFPEDSQGPDLLVAGWKERGYHTRKELMYKKGVWVWIVWRSLKKAGSEKNPGSNPSEIGKEIQSIYFDKKYFSEEAARRWVKKHKGTLKYGMDAKKNVMRFRQWPPGKCARFYTLDSKNSDLPKGVAFVVCAERK